MKQAKLTTFSALATFDLKELSGILELEKSLIQKLHYHVKLERFKTVEVNPYKKIQNKEYQYLSTASKSFDQIITYSNGAVGFRSNSSINYKTWLMCSQIFRCRK